VETYIAEMPNSVAEELLSRAGKEGPSVARIDEGFESFARSHDGVKILGHPQLVVQDGALAAISNSKEEEYVKDYTLGEAGRSTPIRSTVEEGYWLEARPRVRPDSNSFEVACKVKQITLLRPIPDAEVTLPGSGEKVTVQLPSLQTLGTTGNATLSNGESLVLNLGQAQEDKSRRIVAVLNVALQSGS
jgi:type II secretory pathway component GspD/PulD (secretin)